MTQSEIHATNFTSITTSPVWLSPLAALNNYHENNSSNNNNTKPIVFNVNFVLFAALITTTTTSAIQRWSTSSPVPVGFYN